MIIAPDRIDWERLYRQAYPSLYRALVATVFDLDLAADALQDAFVADPTRLIPYWIGRFAMNDRFDRHVATYAPPGPHYDTGNPTVTFTRSFARGTQQGDLKLVCGGGKIIALIINSEYPEWESRTAFDLWFSVPKSWTGPTDLQTVKDSGAPLNWLVFNDAAGATQVTIWLWRGSSIEEVVRNTMAGRSATSMFVTDAGVSRMVLEIRASASWSSPTGGGTYENRHLLVQVTPTLVADVIVNAPLVNGASKVTTIRSSCGIGSRCAWRRRTSASRRSRTR